MFNKLKAIKDLRSEAKEIQSALSEESIEGSGAHGKVKITMDGNQQVQSVELSEEILENRAKLQDGIKDAINDSIKKVQKAMAAKMKDMGGLDKFKDLM